MDNDEADRLLRGLRATLGEFGATTIGPPRHAAIEDGPEPDVRTELRWLLDEYEAILVDAPEMIQWTMRSLGARSLTFTLDSDDMRFGQGDAGARARPDEIPGVTFTPESIGEWLQIAGDASEVIAELRRELDAQPR
jgi:hypothetical protein